MVEREALRNRPDLLLVHRAVRVHSLAGEDDDAVALVVEPPTPNPAGRGVPAILHGVVVLPERRPLLRSSDVTPHETKRLALDPAALSVVLPCQARRLAAAALAQTSA